jgi:hypothetical protein
VGGLAAAWITAEGIVAWREVQKSPGRLPVPGAMLGVTGLYLVLAIAAGYGPAKFPVTALAWGLNVAGFLNVLPGGLFGQIQQTQTSEATAEGETANAS